MIATMSRPLPTPGTIYLTTSGTAGTGTWNLTYPTTMATGSNSPWLDSVVSVVIPPSKTELRRRQLAVWTREAIEEACVLLRSTPLPEALKPSKMSSQRPYGPARYKGRICALSSRYRILQP